MTVSQVGKGCTVRFVIPFIRNIISLCSIVFHVFRFEISRKITNKMQRLQMRLEFFMRNLSLIPHLE